MYTFTEYCEKRDEQPLNEVGWEDLQKWGNVAKQAVGNWLGKKQAQSEPTVNVYGKPVKPSDVSVGGLERKQRPKLSPEDIAVASRLGRNIESRMSNTSLAKALVNYGYSTKEAEDIIDANPSYEPLWNKYLLANESLKNVYINAWKQGQRDTVRRMLQKMFDQAIGHNIIGMPALLAQKPEPKQITPERVTDQNIMTVAKSLLLQGGKTQDVVDDLVMKYIHAGVHLPALKSRIRRIVNVVIDKLNQQGKLGPRKIARGTQRTVQQPQPAEEPRLRLYQ